MTARLALFDLDNTLLAGDSDYAWGEFLIAEQLVDEDTHRAQNDAFYRDYERGELDIHAYVKFTLGPVLNLTQTERDTLHQRFMARSVLPLMQDKAKALIEDHKVKGDNCVIITATNAFITAPIAKALGIPKLLATDLEEVDGRFTGNIAGTPCYQEGKVEKLEQWLQSQSQLWRIEEACFYSDSVNDVPLLEKVGEPIVVDPDTALSNIADERNWPNISLRS